MTTTTMTAAPQHNGATIDGSNRSELLIGTRRDDVIDGNGGCDLIFAGCGNDYVISDGKDWIFGGWGHDTVDFSDAASGVVVDLKKAKVGVGSFDDEIADFAADPLDASVKKVVKSALKDADYGGKVFSIESVVGTEFGDIIKGNRKDNVLDGAGGDDILIAGGGNTTLIGGDGNDVMIGGRGDNTFVSNLEVGTIDTIVLGTVGKGKTGADKAVNFDVNGRTPPDTESSFDILVFTFKGTDYELSATQDFFDFSKVLADDGDNDTNVFVTGTDVILDFGNGDSILLEDVNRGDPDLDPTELVENFGAIDLDLMIV